MKKVFKISALALAVVVMCLSFCGCAELDDMRESHAVWTQKGNTDSITYNGEVYKLLDNIEGHNPMYTNDWDNTLYVTEPDVPVLLSTDFGVDLQLSTDGKFITGYLHDEYKTDVHNEYGVPYLNEFGTFSDSDTVREVCYCKEDIYEEMRKKIDAGINYTGYGYEYWNYDSVGDPYHYHYLSDEDVKLINEVVEKVKPDTDNEIPYEYMSICILDEVSDDKSFGKSSYEVYYYGDGNYCLGLWIDNGKCKAYEVPEKYSDEFDRIFKIALEHSEYWDM